MPNTRGRYIVLEGGEGVGKTTQLELLIKRLQSLNITLHRLQEPGGDPLALVIRRLIKQESHDKDIIQLFNNQPYSISPLAELLLFNAARAQNLEIIDRHLAQGEWVISDRSFLSSIAYQGHGGGVLLDQTRRICEIVVEQSMPDLIILLHATGQVVEQRLKQRGSTDRMEQKGEGYHEWVRAGYLSEANRLGLPVVDANQSVPQVEADIWQHIQPLVEEYHG